jgi:hypothetical protein
MQTAGLGRNSWTYLSAKYPGVMVELYDEYDGGFSDPTYVRRMRRIRVLPFHPEASGSQFRPREKFRFLKEYDDSYWSPDKVQLPFIKDRSPTDAEVLQALRDRT